MTLFDPYHEFQTRFEFEELHGVHPSDVDDEQCESEFEGHLGRLYEVLGRPAAVRTDAAYSVDPETWLPSMSQLIERATYAVRSIEGTHVPRDVARAAILKALRVGAVPASPVAILAWLVADGFAGRGFARYFLRAFLDWGAVVKVPASIRVRPLATIGGR